MRYTGQKVRLRAGRVPHNDKPAGGERRRDDPPKPAPLLPRQPWHQPEPRVKVLFILEPSEQAKAAIGKRVTVIDYPDGRLSIRCRGVELAYRTFYKIRQVSQAAIVERSDGVQGIKASRCRAGRAVGYPSRRS